MSKLDVGLSHDVVLLDGEGTGKEGLGDSWGGIYGVLFIVFMDYYPVECQ